MTIMTADEKKRFMNDLITDFRKEVERDVDRLPNDWQGLQLRQYLVDRFSNKVLQITMSRSEMKDYRNDLANSPL